MLPPRIVLCTVSTFGPFSAGGPQSLLSVYKKVNHRTYKTYMCVQCTPLLVEKACLAPDVAIRFTAGKQVSVQRENQPGFKTHREGHTKSKTEAISGPTKWTLVQQKFKK